MAFLCDVETLGLESTSIVLSAAVTYFDIDSAIADDHATTMSKIFKDYVKSSCVVKFDVLEQKKMNRIVDPDTLKWWQNQSQVAQFESLMPSDKDVSAVVGIDKLRAYIDEHSKNNQTNIVLARGCLDPMVMESLARFAKVQPITPHYMWRDVRTLVDIIANTSNGYCDIKNFNYQQHAVKHIPSHDCALDIMQILYHV